MAVIFWLVFNTQATLVSCLDGLCCEAVSGKYEAYNDLSVGHTHDTSDTIMGIKLAGLKLLCQM